MLTLPALKVQQFAQEFYLVNLAAADVERLVRFEVLGDTLPSGNDKGPKRRRSNSLVNWAEIERKVQTSEKAFQRPILRKKVEELAEHFIQCREEGEVPAIPGAILLTVEQPVEFTANSGNPFLGLVQLPEDEGTLRVLDGQHRLLALAALQRNPELRGGNSQDARLLQVPAILFAGLPAPNIIEMFVTINAKHTRLNPSLLASLAGRQLYAEPRAALIHDVLRKLNGTSTSPLHGHIKMFGVGPGRVQQSGLAQELRATLDALQKRVPDQMASLESQADKLFMNYFREVAHVFGAAWESKKHATRSMTALRAFLRVVPEVVVRGLATGLAGREAIRLVLAPWATRVGADRFETAGAWRAKQAAGGKESIRLLTRELESGLGGVA